MERQLSYQLGTYTLEPSARILRHEQQPVHLTGIPFQVLVYLLENRDRLVSRAELLDRFWEGRDVYEASLTKAIGAIRKALNDPKDQPLFIETRYGEGYRYIGPCVVREPETAALEPDWAEARHSTPALELPRSEVQPETKTHANNGALKGALNGVQNGAIHDLGQHPQTITTQAPLTTPSSNFHRHWRRWLFGVLIIVTLLGPALALKLRQAKPEPRSLAVLPLKNLSSDPGQEYFSDGLTDHLINTLAKLDGLKVIARGSAFTFKGQTTDPQEIGEKLGVNAILTGSVLKRGERVRVEVRLLNAKDGRVLWASDTSDHALGDIFALQDEIARRAVEGLKIKLGAEGERRLAKRDTDNAEAYQAYLKGRYFLNQRTPEAITKSMEYFNRAIAISPNYALAYAGLAEAHNKAFWFIEMRPEERMKESEAATKALALDDGLGEPHVARANAHINQWELANAVKEGARALALSPGDAEAHHTQAYALVLSGRPDEAVAEIKRARELDPLNVVMNVDVGEILLYARRYDEAIEALKQAIEMDAGRRYAYYDLALAYEQKGMYAEAFAGQLKNESLRGLDQEALAALKQAFAESGMSGYWRKRLELEEENAKSNYVAPIILARLHAQVGNKDQAFDYLEKAYAERSPALTNLKIELTLDNLRSDPRYADLVRRVGLY